jgi:hypothetical protein
MPKAEIETHLAIEATVGSGDFAYERVNGQGSKTGTKGNTRRARLSDQIRGFRLSTHFVVAIW